MRRILSVVFSLIITLRCLSPVLAAEDAGFSDVSPEDWFAPYVEVCVEKGLLQGTGDGKFEPERELTDPECLTLALRLYDLRQGGSGTLKTAPAEWSVHIESWWRDTVYTYVSLEDPEGLEALLWFFIDEDGTIYCQYDGFGATQRLAFAQAIDRAAGSMDAINEISALPDTNESAVLRLYQAGILTGVDEMGTFHGEGSLTRAEAATMLARVINPSLRQSFSVPSDAVFAPFEENGRYGLKDAAGTVRIPAQYTYLMVEEDGFVIVTDQKGNKGILDTEGNVVLPCLYPRIYNSPDEEGLVVVGSAGDYASPLHYNGKKGMINTLGDVIIPLEYDFLTPFEGGQASFLRRSGEETVFGHLRPDGIELPLTAEEITQDDPLYLALYMLGLVGS